MRCRAHKAAVLALRFIVAMIGSDDCPSQIRAHGHLHAAGAACSRCSNHLDEAPRSAGVLSTAAELLGTAATRSSGGRLRRAQLVHPVHLRRRELHHGAAQQVLHRIYDEGSVVLLNHRHASVVHRRHQPNR